MLRLKATPVGRLQNIYRVLARVNSTDVATSEVPKGWDTAKPFHTIPGPKPLPLIGNVWRFLPVIGEFAKMDLATTHHKFVKQYGKITRLGGLLARKDLILLYDADDIQNVYRNEGVWPIRDGMRAFAYYRSVTRKDVFEGAGGALATQGAEWGKFRSTVNQPMMQPRVAQVYVGPIDVVAEDFMNKIPALRDSATGEMPADFINELYKWALESIVMIALDTRLGCLEGNLDPDSEAQKMIDNVQVIFECMFKLDIKQSMWKYVSTPTWRKFVGAMDFFTEICTKYIDKSIERSKTLPPDHEPSVLERILARDSNPKTAMTMAIDMMTAGIDTTSHSVAFLLYYLATNPEAQKKLHQEIDRVLPRDSKEPITAENLNDMKYLKACMKESMRISPIAVGNMRTTVKDMVLQGYKIPKNTDLILGHMTMSRQEEHFKQPESFIPERWMKDDTDGDLSYKKAHPFAYMPFGFGPRSCVGRRFAEMEIEVLVAKVMRKYELEWHHPPMVSESKLLHTCKSPLRFKMIDRK